MALEVMKVRAPTKQGISFNRLETASSVDIVWELWRLCAAQTISWTQINQLSLIDVTLPIKATRYEKKAAVFNIA